MVCWAGLLNRCPRKGTAGSNPALSAIIMTMKKCYECGKRKALDQFSKRKTSKDGLRLACRECEKERSAAYYKANRSKWHDRRLETRDKLMELKSTLKCQLCLEDEPRCLDFHHLDPTTKKFDIARGVRDRLSWKSVLKEIEKCVVLCANCHRKVHYGIATLTGFKKQITQCPT